MSRRHFLKRTAMTLASGAVAWQAAHGHGDGGRVFPPIPAPPLPLVDHLGQPQEMRSWIRGRITFVQTVFTGCTSVCSIQGATFAALQSELRARKLSDAIGLVSLSVDALGDTPRSLSEWLARVGARGDNWRAAVPTVHGVELLRQALDGTRRGAREAPAAHSEKVYAFDALGLLRWRSANLPPVSSLVFAAEAMVTR